MNVVAIVTVFAVLLVGGTVVWVHQRHASPKQGEPPLHRAAREGNHEAIRELLDRGADLEQLFDLSLDPDAAPGWATPLMVAAGSGDGATVDTVALLLELGADPKKEVDGRSAAVFACLGLGWNYHPGGDNDRLKLLLEKGSPLDLEEHLGSRLVADVARFGDPKRLGTLLELGAPVDAHFDPEQAANEDAADAIVDPEQAAKEEAAYQEDFKAMLRELDLPFAEEFEELGVDLNLDLAQHLPLNRQSAGPWSHEIPLFQAVTSGSPECVRLLLDAGATVDCRDFQGRTALFYADNSATIGVLLEAGLSLENRDENQWTPLMNALSEGEDIEAQVAHVRVLIQAGADVNATNDNGDAGLLRR